MGLNTSGYGSGLGRTVRGDDEGEDEDGEDDEFRGMYRGIRV